MKNIKGNLTKLFVILFIAINIILSIAVAPTVAEGIEMYSTAADKDNLNKKIDEIRSCSTYVSFEDIPQSLKDTVVSVEDHRFYYHIGFDVIAIGRAVISNFISHGKVAGGSTITQQLAKNLFFSFEKTYSRKVAELIMAVKLEEKLTKNEILELYLNVIYYGNGYYGIQQASQGYFNIDASELNQEQAIILAGIPQSPNYYSLKNADKNIKHRVEIVLCTLVNNKYIKERQAQIESIKTQALIERCYSSYQ